MSADKPQPEDMRRRGQIGGYARVASQTPEQRSESARNAVKARWAKENARRAAAGEPPTKKTPQPLDAESLKYYLERVDEKFGTDYPWRYPSDRKRQAVALAREDAARAAAEAFARRERGDL
ncbi:hypothetical protein [Microbacterium paulum]